MLKTLVFRYCALCFFSLILHREIKNDKNENNNSDSHSASSADEPHLHMVLFTCNNKYGEQVVSRLESQGIPYLLQPAGRQNQNIYFGRRECLEAIRLIVTRPLNELTPEEDFILGAMLGYDICAQCERYCKRKNGCKSDCDGNCINKN